MNEIIKVEIGTLCYEVSPCLYDVKVHYSNGKIEKKLETAETIKQKYNKYLSSSTTTRLN